MATEYKSLKEKVYEHVSSLIDSGSLNEGDKIVEREIQDALGVSRTPVREALIQLVGDGYLESTPHRGFRVRGFDEKSAREVFQMVGPLDGRAALLALPNMSEDDLRQMRFLCDSIDLAISNRLADRYNALQKEFHEVYFARCGNERLVGALHELQRSFSTKAFDMDNPADTENMRKANSEHRHIISLFERGDGAALQDYVRDVHWSLEYVGFSTW